MLQGQLSLVLHGVEFGSQLFAALPRVPEAASHSLHVAADVIITAPVGEGRGISVVTLNSFGFNPLGASLLGPASSWPVKNAWRTDSTE